MQDASSRVSPTAYCLLHTAYWLYPSSCHLAICHLYDCNHILCEKGSSMDTVGIGMIGSGLHGR